MPLVSEKEIEKCEGIVVDEVTSKELKLPRADGVCNSRIPLRLEGFDHKWRCPDCHRIHIELVFADTKQKNGRVHV